jgi:tRNA A-37 threonylcarbamoyl transferase component Bud32/tetratricopeptide (TPR) repeat protein
MSRSVMKETKKCRSCGVEVDDHSVACNRCLVSEELLRPRLFSPLPTAGPAPRELDGEQGADFGDYVLLNEIGRGGMGCVYRARQKRLNRIVALKRPLPGVAADEHRVQRFRVEAEAVAALAHPNIIPVFESGECEGEPYFSMGYVEGDSLNEVLRRRSVSPAQAARYVRKIALAIHHAHQRGVLHRDLKPANIIIDAADEPLVADFGIAQLLRGSEVDEVTSVAGTANYMAPEQTQPGNKQLSVATDVYALGGILYHLLAGCPPFDGKSREEILWAAYYEEPVPPRVRNPALSRDLEAICLKALEKDPDKRYASAQALAEDLERFLQRRPVVARPVILVQRVWMWIHRNPFIAALMILLTAALATAIVLQWFALQNVRTARAASEGFIGFMNGDLTDDLRDAGRLDLMEKVNAKAEDYYTNYTAIGDSGYWERKALFFENAAGIERDLGELSRAESRAVQAEAIYEQQHRSEPHPRWTRSQSRVRLLRLSIAKNAGRIPIAEQHGQAALKLASAALELEPRDITNQANVADVLLAQANLWLGEARTEAPFTNVVQAEALLRGVVQAPGADPDWSLSLANCAYYRGRIHQLRGKPTEALAEFTRYVELMQALVARFPLHVRWQYELTVAYSRVSETLTLMKQYTSAKAYLNTFESSARNLTQLDPRNAAWLELHGLSLIWQGYLKRNLNFDNPVARDYLQAGLVVQSNLLVRNPDWNRWADAAALATAELVTWFRTTGQQEQGLAVLAQWREQCRQRALKSPEHSGHQLRFGEAIVDEIDEIAGESASPAKLALLHKAVAELADLPPGSQAPLAKARLRIKLATTLDRLGDPTNAAVHADAALRLRVDFLERSPSVAKVRTLVRETFSLVVGYHLKSGEILKANEVAEESLSWALKHLFAEDARASYARMCLRLTQAPPDSNGRSIPLTKRLVARCLAERLAGAPALSESEAAYAQNLREWLDQHP